ncbi:MAG: hypothetical protein ABFC34_09705 [Methanobacterium sp.]
MESYICSWCGGLERKDDPIFEDNNKFCSVHCLENYRQSIEHDIIEKVLNEDISFLDMPRWLRDKTSLRIHSGYSAYAHKCVICGNLFYSYKEDRKKCCSHECYEKRIAEIAERNKMRNVGWTVHTWAGGVSFGEYCPKFNADLKRRVRAFFGNKCFLCGKTQEENKKKLCVHHVNYNKNACCDSSKVMFVPLCTSCHTSTNFSRGKWENYFETILREKYDYKCYYTKEEYNNLKAQELTS